MIKFKCNKRTLPPVVILNKTKPGRITLSDVKMHHTVMEVQPKVVLTITDRLKELNIANRNQSIHLMCDQFSTEAPRIKSEERTYSSTNVSSENWICTCKTKVKQVLETALPRKNKSHACQSFYKAKGALCGKLQCCRTEPNDLGIFLVPLRACHFTPLSKLTSCGYESL